MRKDRQKSKNIYARENGRKIDQARYKKLKINEIKEHNIQTCKESKNKETALTTHSQHPVCAFFQNDKHKKNNKKSKNKNKKNKEIKRRT